METQKIILVAQAPSKDSRPPEVPFGGRPGRALAALMGVEPVNLHLYFERLDLVADGGHVAGSRGDRFDFEGARKMVAERHAVYLKGRLAIFLGSKVATVFDSSASPALVWYRDVERGFTFAIYPHPSGVDPFWKDAANVAKAKAFFGSIVQERAA